MYILTHSTFSQMMREYAHAIYRLVGTHWARRLVIGAHLASPFCLRLPGWRAFGASAGGWRALGASIASPCGSPL